METFEKRQGAISVGLSYTPGCITERGQGVFLLRISAALRGLARTHASTALQLALQMHVLLQRYPQGRCRVGHAGWICGGGAAGYLIYHLSGHVGATCGCCGGLIGH